MYVLYVVLKDEISCLYLSQNLVKCFCQRYKFIFCQKSDRFQHSDVCLRTDNVIFSQTHVKNPVISDCKFLYQVSCLRALTPKCTHKLFLFVFSLLTPVISSEVERSYESNVFLYSFLNFLNSNKLILPMRSCRVSRPHLYGIACDPHPVGCRS